MPRTGALAAVTWLAASAVSHAPGRSAPSHPPPLTLVFTTVANSSITYVTFDSARNATDKRRAGSGASSEVQWSVDNATLAINKSTWSARAEKRMGCLRLIGPNQEYSTQPFFNETACYKFPLDKPPGQNADIFRGIVSRELFHGYEDTKYIGQSDGLQLWRLDVSSQHDMDGNCTKGNCTKHFSADTTLYYIKHPGAMPPGKVPPGQVSPQGAEVVRIHHRERRRESTLVNAKQVHEVSSDYNTTTVFSPYEQPSMQSLRPPSDVKGVVCANMIGPGKKPQRPKEAFPAMPGFSWHRPEGMGRSPGYGIDGALPYPPSQLFEAVNSRLRIAAINLQAALPLGLGGISWQAGAASRFEDMSNWDSMKTTMGTLMPPQSRMHIRSRPIWGKITPSSPSSPSSRTDIPVAFDARHRWPKCNSIARLRNQGKCGGCWAVAAVEVLQDRLCISGAQIPETPPPETGLSRLLELAMPKPPGPTPAPPMCSFRNSTDCLSAEYLIQCDRHDDGCDGGYIDNAWRFLTAMGVPTEACDPYTQCLTNPKLHNCSGTSHLRCPDKCHDNSTMAKLWATDAYAVGAAGDVAAIQSEIMHHGPVETGMYAYSDFQTYKSGIYTRTKDAAILGAHAVKIIGWGVGEESAANKNAKDVPYWLVTNSWGEDWGEGGLARIKRGVNECGIETTVAAGTPLPWQPGTPAPR